MIHDSSSAANDSSRNKKRSRARSRSCSAENLCEEVSQSETCPLNEGDESLLDYYTFVGKNSNWRVSVISITLVFLLLVLKARFSDTKTSRFLVMSRLATVITIVMYFVVLYRTQHGKKSLISLRVCGDIVILQRVIVGGIWIHHSMKNVTHDSIPFDVVLESVISVGANIIFGVHSSWSAATVWLTHTVVAYYYSGVNGSGAVAYLDISVLSIVTAVITMMTEVHQIDSYKSYCDKHHLIQQLATKTKEMRSLIGNVAHDLKTPLQAFVSELENISDNDVETRESLSGIADFMTMMINRSIEFTKVQSGHGLKPSLESVNISSCIEWVTNTIAQSGKSEFVTISSEYDMQGALEWIITDKHWLLENLLCYMSNAVKFVAEGTIVIKVSAEYDSDRNNSNNEDLIAKKEIGTCQVTTSSNSNKFRTMYSVPVIPSGALPTSASNRPLLNAPDMNDNNSNYCNQLQTLKFIRFTVVDSGIGIPEDKLGGLFQPFFQAQKSAGGTGLGLYALSNRIKALQGQYGAGGREDGAQGSEFWFSIPYRPDTELNDDSVKAYEEEIKRSSLCFNRFNETTSTGRSKLGSCDVEELANHIDGDLRQNELESTQSISLITETSQLHLPRVLLVDDSNMIRKASTRALEKNGFRVTSAVNGVECLQRLKEAKESGDLYCVVLLDLQMPVLDGFETVKRIREEERLSDLEAGVVACSSTTGDGDGDGAVVSFPTSWSMCNSGRRQYVIGLSANSDTESIDCVAAAGMDNFIAKPLKVSTLRKVCGPQKAL